MTDSEKLAAIGRVLDAMLEDSGYFEVVGSDVGEDPTRLVIFDGSGDVPTADAEVFREFVNEAR